MARTHAFDRWLYRGNRPNRLARVINGASARLAAAGLECSPGARSHIPVGRGAPLAEFERIAAQYPVFRVRQREMASEAVRKGCGAMGMAGGLGRKSLSGGDVWPCRRGAG